MSERRCPSCGALVAADAEWCGQCLASLREPSSAGSPGSAGRNVRAPFGRDERDGPPSVWRCPTCDAENGLDANTCRICGTSFSRLFEDPATAPAASPGAAAAWSLLVPGLGHWLAGRRAEAVARFVLAAWIVAMLVVLLSSRVGGAGFGGAMPLVVLFAVAAVALWAEGALDGRRAAAGRRPLVSSRAMLWACVALVGLSIVLSTLLAVPGLQGGPAK
jgi:ribosomal protein L40E